MLHRLQCRFLGVEFVKSDEEYVTTFENVRKKRDLNEKNNLLWMNPRHQENILLCFMQIHISQMNNAPPITLLFFITPPETPSHVAVTGLFCQND